MAVAYCLCAGLGNKGLEKHCLLRIVTSRRFTDTFKTTNWKPLTAYLLITLKFKIIASFGYFVLSDTET